MSAHVVLAHHFDVHRFLLELNGRRYQDVHPFHRHGRRMANAQLDHVQLFKRTVPEVLRSRAYSVLLFLVGNTVAIFLLSITESPFWPTTTGIFGPDF